jgi:zinc transport system permease protein
VIAVLASALGDPGFPRALLACVAVGAFAPTIGAFLVQKRLSLIGDGVGHVAFAGVGLGLLVGVWPVWTALAFAVTGAVALELLRAKRRVAGDLALALFFYAGIALGVVFAAKAGDLDLETLPYLFGDPLQMSTGALAAVLGAASAFVGAVVGQLFDLSISGTIVLVAAAVFAVVSLARRSLPAAVVRSAA